MKKEQELTREDIRWKNETRQGSKYRENQSEDRRNFKKKIAVIKKEPATWEFLYKWLSSWNSRYD